MKIKSIISIIFITLVSCKTAKDGHKYGAAPGPTPMSCRVQGKIISIINTLDADTGSVCSRYPCRARVLIMDVSECGSSVSAPLGAADTVEMSFAFTLRPTAKAIPGMKAQYPGLKKGDVFITRVEQRLRMGTDPGYIVYGYEVK